MAADSFRAVFTDYRSFPVFRNEFQLYFCFILTLSVILSEYPHYPFLENLISKTIVKTKNQVMKRFRLMMEDENVQARLVIAGFVMAFALIFIFFY